MFWIIFLLSLFTGQLCVRGEDQEQFNLTGNYCQQKWSCKTEDETLRTCQCDVNCDVYGDCCEDVNATISVISKKVHPSSSYLNCEYFPEIKNESYIYMINVCPAHAEEFEIKLCESPNNTDIYDRTPVYGKGSGFIYRNRYCAMCHQENFFFLVQGINCEWKYKYQGNYTIDGLLGSDECRLIYQIPDVSSQPRSCFPLTYPCGNINAVAEKCRSASVNLVFTEKEIFKNPVCTVCSDTNNTMLSCSPSHALFLPKRKRTRFNYSYRLLFDLNTKRRSSVAKYRSRITEESDNDFSSNCAENQVYDPFLKICQNIVCNPPYLYENGECVLSNSSWNVSGGTVCPSIKVNLSEVQIINDSTIHLVSSGKVYTQFHLSETFAYICINHDQRAFAVNYLETFSREEGTLSLVCGILSVIFLFIAFLIYASNPKLQNIPGKNLLSLITSLLLAQLLFIVAPALSYSPPWCAVFAVSIHYSFLTSFFWMNVMSFDIFYTFSSGFKKSGEKGQSSKRFRYYSLYAWSIPTVLVINAVCMDLLSSSDYKPRYGDVVCWITNPNALLVFFLIPLAVLLFFNLIFFVITAKNIYVSEHKTSKILKRKESCKLLIYIKLSVVMGMTWISGFVATGADDIVWWYMFIVFNALQGVFIFLSFVLTRKVIRMVRDRTRKVYMDYRSYSMFGKSSSLSTRSTTLIGSQGDTTPPKHESRC